METVIRNALVSDLPMIFEIRNYYIFNSKALFETEPSSFQERLSWFNRYQPHGPYQIWVAEQEGKVLGYAFSSPYRVGDCFSKTIETSIYLHPNSKGQGIGSLLYSQLFEDLKNEDLHTALAGVGLPNEPSVALHKKFGFREVGIFKDYAQKKGKFISSIWLQKMLRE